ncbi:MAG: metallophosphoesterase [Treponemataceae bacterium]|nr:metallophosphoesterase [Treponemataceae bacterium]
MFAFVQHQSFLLGTPDAIHTLARKKTARLLVLSDSHGNTNIVRAIVGTFGADCDALCFCGDGARDMLSVFATFVSKAEKASLIPPVVALARGNGDAESYVVQSQDAQVTYRVPKSQELTAADKNVLLAHGHQHDVYYGTEAFFHAAKRERADVALFGHTHIPYAAHQDGILLLNPGSCARPRRSSPASFAVVTIGEHNPTYQFYAIDENSLAFSAYDPPQEEMSLLWQ